MTIRETGWPTGTPCWLDILVPDVDAALAFYGSVLGWSFADTGPDFGHYRIAQVDGRDAAGIGTRHTAEQAVAWTVYLASDDVAKSVQLVTEHGGTVLAGPVEVGDLCQIAIAQDPTGAVFGIYQAQRSVGIQVHSEPGGLIWEEARLTDVAIGRDFYRAVFGLRYTEIPGVAFDQYGTFVVPGSADDRPAGGLGRLVGEPDGGRGHWLAYLSVADVDAAVASAISGGGRELRAAENTPYGRISIVADPFGAPFGLHAELSQSG